MPSRLTYTHVAHCRSHPMLTYLTNWHPLRHLWPRQTLGVLALVAILGCGGQPRTSVTGEVTFDGQPLPAGQIVFEPKTAGRLGIAQISQGAYAMPAEHGPTAGTYVVRITANRPTGRKVKSGRDTSAASSMDQYEQYIPARYNDHSELTTEIGAEAETDRDFALNSK